jgi:hypothetical protein
MYAEAVENIVSFENSESYKRNARQILRIKFEDLCNDTVETLKSVLNWARLDPERFDWGSLNELPVKGSSFLRNDDGEIDFTSGVRKDASFKPQGRWIHWSTRQRAVFARESGKAQQLIGYGMSWSGGDD